MMGGQVPCNETAPIVADKVEPIGADGVGEGQHIARQFLDPIRIHVGWASPWRVAALIERQRPEGATEERDDAVPRACSLREPVQQDHALGIGRAAIDDVEREAVVAELRTATRHAYPQRSRPILELETQPSSGRRLPLPVRYLLDMVCWENDWEADDDVDDDHGGQDSVVDLTSEPA